MKELKMISFRLTAIIILLFTLGKTFAADRFDLKVCRDKAAYYFAEHDIMQGDKTLKYAVIYVHGASGGAKDGARRLRQEMKRYNQSEKVYCIAPSFFIQKTCPEALRGKAMLWEKSWRAGDKSVNGNNFGSYEVIDKIYAALSDPELYPAMKRITLCGFSAGGQFVNRYIAVGKLPVAKHIETVFVVGNPSVYLYIDKMRFVNGKFQEINEKNDFNTWYYGLEKRNDYCKKIPLEEIMKNLSSRKTLYFCGSADTKGMRNPEAMLQGKNRYDRFAVYRKYTAMFPQWAKELQFISVPGIPHSTEVFYKNSILPRWILGEKLP